MVTIAIRNKSNGFTVVSIAIRFCCAFHSNTYLTTVVLLWLPQQYLNKRIGCSVLSRDVDVDVDEDADADVDVDVDVGRASEIVRTAALILYQYPRGPPERKL